MNAPVPGLTETVLLWRGELPYAAGHPRDEVQFLRAGGENLREAARTAARLRSSPLAAHLPVLIEVHTLVNRDATKALRQYTDAQARGRDVLAGSLHYVGTPAGLAGLVADIRSLDLADGVILMSCTCLTARQSSVYVSPSPVH